MPQAGRDVAQRLEFCRALACVARAAGSAQAAGRQGKGGAWRGKAGAGSDSASCPRRGMQWGAGVRTKQAGERIFSSSPNVVVKVPPRALAGPVVGAVKGVHLADGGLQSSDSAAGIRSRDCERHTAWVLSHAHILLSFAALRA